MKLALITDPKGFTIVRDMGFSYHLVLAQYVLEDIKYADFYARRAEQGDFLIMDNGAAEGGTLDHEKLMSAAEYIQPDEIVLPDVMFKSEETIKATMESALIEAIAPKMRAVVPQGDSIDEWLTCANYFANNLEFATMCVPKHTERFPGGRNAILKTIRKMGWDRSYHIHLLGIWDDPYQEVMAFREHTNWVRGLDTAAPFAFAQHDLEIGPGFQGHLSHVWGKRFNIRVAIENVDRLNTLLKWRSE